MKKIVLLFTILILLILPVAGEAVVCNGLQNGLNLCYPTFPGAPDINLEANRTLGGIIAWVYTLVIGISGLAAFVMIVWGGVQWMTSAGSPTRTSDAKDRIQKALLGLLLVLSSFLILQVINPELTTLHIAGLETIECPRNELGECMDFELNPPEAGSSGAPAAGTQFQCTGPANSFLFASSQEKIKQAAMDICRTNGGITPTYLVIHDYLSRGGPEKCTAKDVEAVRAELSSSCGPTAGETTTSGDGTTLIINEYTIPQSLCHYYPFPGPGAAGNIFTSSMVKHTISYLPQEGISKPSELFDEIKDNTSALIEDCREQNNNKSYCLLQDNTTPIGGFTPDQELALAKFCYDLLPEF